MSDAELKLQELFDRVLGVTAPPPMAELLARLEARLTVIRPDYLAKLQPGVTDARWQSAVARLGVPVPPAFEALYRWRNGQRDLWHSFVGNRMWMEIDEVVQSKSLLDELWPREEDPGYWESGWVPFLHNGGGSYLCLDAIGTNGNPVGCLVAFWKADRDRPVEAPSLEHWLFQFVKSLETDVWGETDVGFECVRSADD